MSDFILGHSDIGYTCTFSLTTGTWATNLGAAMLNRQLITAIAKTTSVTGGMVLDFDITISQQTEVLGLVNHNLTSAGTYTWEAYSTSAARTTGTTPVYTSGAITAGSYNSDITYKTAITDCGAPQDLTYWRLKLADASNTDGFFQIGRIFMGKRFYPDRNMDYGLAMGVTEPDSELTTSQIGVETFVDAPNKRTATFSFDLADYAGGNEFFKFSLANGIVGTCLFEFDPANREEGIYSFICRQSSLSPLDFPSYNINSFSINLVEII